VHYELIKYLFQQNINANVLSWNNNNYTTTEIQELSNSIDYFVSAPTGIAKLIDGYGIPANKCIAIAHALVDLEHLSWFSYDNIINLHSYCVVSDWLLQKSLESSIPRIPQVTPIGINYHSFYAEPNNSLTTVGYGGAFIARNDDRLINLGYSNQPAIRKRSYLVQEVAEQVNLNFLVAQQYHNSWVTMPGFYKAVDAVIIASTEEGAGLPALEASAAGKLVISTPVGIWMNNLNSSEHTVSIEEKAFLKETAELLNYYKNNNKAYNRKCLETQEYAKRYDWSQVIDKWVRAIN